MDVDVGPVAPVAPVDVGPVAPAAVVLADPEAPVDAVGDLVDGTTVNRPTTCMRT